MKELSKMVVRTFCSFFFLAVDCSGFCWSTHTCTQFSLLVSVITQPLTHSHRNNTSQTHASETQIMNTSPTPSQKQTHHTHTNTHRLVITQNRCLDSAVERLWSIFKKYMVHFFINFKLPMLQCHYDSAVCHSEFTNPIPKKLGY